MDSSDECGNMRENWWKFTWCCDALVYAISGTRIFIFYNITRLKFHVLPSGYLRHLDASKVLDFDGFEMAAPILYPKVVLVHHARSGQSKCLIWAWGQSRESLCHLPVRHNFWNLNHDKISAVIRELSFKVKTPFKTQKLLSLLLPIFCQFTFHLFVDSQSRALGLTMWLHLNHVVSFGRDEGAEWKGPKIHQVCPPSAEVI